MAERSIQDRMGEALRTLTHGLILPFWEDVPEASQDVAEALRAVAHAGDRLLASGLTKRALALLLKDATGIGMRDILLLLEALPALRQYTRPRAKQ